MDGAAISPLSGSLTSHRPQRTRPIVGVGRGVRNSWQRAPAALALLIGDGEGSGREGGKAVASSFSLRSLSALHPPSARLLLDGARLC